MSTWFTWDSDDGFTTHESEQHAKEAAESMLEGWRDLAREEGEWSEEEVERLCYGVIVGETRSRRIEYDGDKTDSIDFQLVNSLEAEREDRALDALIVAAMRGIDPAEIEPTGCPTPGACSCLKRNDEVESLLRESLGWLKTYKCGEGDRLVERIESALSSK